MRHIAAAIFLGLGVWGTAGASPHFESLLREADRIRTTDPVRLGRMLEQLDRSAGTATRTQAHHLQLLHAYGSILAGRYPESIARLEELLAQKPAPELRFRATSLLATNYAATRQFSEAFAAADRMLALGETLTDRDLQQQGLLNAAMLYNQAGKHALARNYAERILADGPNVRNRCFAWHYRVEALFGMRELPPGDALLEEALAACEAANEKILQGFIRSHMAQRWHAGGETRKAIAMLERHLPGIAATRYPRVIGELQSLLAEYHLEAGNVARAESYAHAAIANSTGTPYPLPLVGAYRVLYQVDLRRGDHRAALDDYRRYSEADKAYLNEIQARELAYQMARHETLQKNQQIALLDRRNQVLQLKQRVDMQSRQNTQLLAAFLGLLVATIGYWAWKTKRMQMAFRTLAETDMLTGIGNRHHFTRQAQDALQHCRRNGEDVGLILFDLDNFKSINDRFGHIVGDFVLMQVAQACKENGRRNDRFARIGGEEFAILLPGCDLEATTRAAHECRRRIEELDTSASGHAFVVTASFGVATASLSGHDLSRMMSHADQLLYRSKREGRNQVNTPLPATPASAPGHTPTRQPPGDVSTSRRERS